MSNPKFLGSFLVPFLALFSVYKVTNTTSLAQKRNPSTADSAHLQTFSGVLTSSTAFTTTYTDYNSMEDSAWSPVPSTASRSYTAKLKSHFELCIDFEEVDGDDELQTAYPCLSCGEDFDLLELCCHIEEDHSVEAKTGICPLCFTWVGTNLVEHISAQHENVLKIQLFEPYGALSLSRKDLLDGDGYWQSFSTGSSSEISTSKTECDPLLSFLYGSAAPDERENLQPGSSSKVSVEEVESTESVLARDGQQSLSDEDQIGKAQRSAFVQELFMSTILDPDF